MARAEAEAKRLWRRVPPDVELAYIDAQGGRPQGFLGTRLDGNVTLYRRAP